MTEDRRVPTTEMYQSLEEKNTDLMECVVSLRKANKELAEDLSTQTKVIRRLRGEISLLQKAVAGLRPLEIPALLRSLVDLGRGALEAEDKHLRDDNNKAACEINALETEREMLRDVIEDLQYTGTNQDGGEDLMEHIVGLRKTVEEIRTENVSLRGNNTVAAAESARLRAQVDFHSETIDRLQAYVGKIQNTFHINSPDQLSTLGNRLEDQGKIVAGIQLDLGEICTILRNQQENVEVIEQSPAVAKYADWHAQKYADIVERLDLQDEITFALALRLTNLEEIAGISAMTRNETSEGES